MNIPEQKTHHCKVSDDFVVVQKPGYPPYWDLMSENLIVIWDIKFCPFCGQKL